MVKKKTYRKPQINQVSLVPEEAVLSGCKAIGTGDINKNIGQCQNPNQSCMAVGS